jgi:hypothetical protein
VGHISPLLSKLVVLLFLQLKEAPLVPLATKRNSTMTLPVWANSKGVARRKQRVGQSVCANIGPKVK